MKYVLRSDVVLVTVLDESMLVTVNEMRGGVENMRSVNETGAYFWRLMEKKLSVEEIVAQAMLDYGIAEDVARPALTRFLNDLCTAGYLSLEE